MSADVMETTELSMDETIETVKTRLTKIRTGKASPAILDALGRFLVSTATLTAMALLALATLAGLQQVGSSPVTILQSCCHPVIEVC